MFLNSCSNKTENTKDFNDFKFLEYDIERIQKGYKNNEFSIAEVTQAYLDRIKSIDESGPSLNSVITVNPDALEIAKELDKELKAGKSRGPLHGIPVILKDNIDTKDKMPCTAGSRALENSFPLQDSEVAKLLREAGAVIIGKANLSEWANFRGEPSSSGWSGLGGQTRNPYDLTRNPCGSSSGSAVAVSANLTILAIGTETNGSIVCPSQTNGIVGLKPTVGLISRAGIIPISFTQDTPGPMGRTVKDVAIALGALTGLDSLDTKTLDSKDKFYKDYTVFLKKDGIKNKRIGYYKNAEGINSEVDSLMKKSLDYLKSQGAEIVEITSIYDDEINNMSFEIMLYEYKDGLNKYFSSLGENAPIKSLKELIAFNLSDSIELKYYDQRFLLMAQEKESITSDSYKNLLEKMLKGVREDGMDKVMNENHLDAIVAPTGSPAWKTDLINGDHFQLSSSSAAAISGYPSITVPMGNIKGLPVGISFFGRAWSEPILLEIAYSYEQGTNHRIIPQFILENY